VLPIGPPVLRLAPLSFRLETAGPFRVPEYKGALFRGGFGQYFRDLVCVTRAPVCTGCPHLSSCPYSLVFETPVIPGQFTVLRKYPNAPHPFVLTPPLDPRTEIAAGAKLDLGVTLIGRGIRIYVWDRRSGRQGRRVQMDGVVGTLEAEGDLTELANWYRLGEWVHVGSGTSMGMGRYWINVEE